MDRITVTIDVEALQAALEVIGAAVGSQREHDTPLNRAEFALDRALLAYEEEEANTWRQTACKICGSDVEGDTAVPNGEWRDRGGNTTCHVYEGRDEWDEPVFITPPAGTKHVPILP